MTSIELDVKIERFDPRVPRFVVVPAAAVASWRLTETTTVDVAINGIDFGRKSLAFWDGQRWSINLSDAMCKTLHADTGTRVRVRLSIADSALPAELQELIDRNARARAQWERLTGPQQRMLREHVAAAKQSATRLRRAERELS